MARRRKSTVDLAHVKTSTTFTVFNSPEEYANYLETISPKFRADDSGDYNTEFHGKTYTQAVQAIREGVRSYGEKAQAMVDKMADEQIFNVEQQQVVSAQVGFMPNVGGYMSGSPYDMFNVEKTDNESLTTPIRVYVETLVSAGVSHKELINRGVCIMAFVLAMQAIRPVELYAMCIGQPCGSRTGGAVIRIPSNPIELGQAGFMLCDPAFYRRLAFSAMQEHVKLDYTGWIQWPWNNSPWDSSHEDMYRELLDMQDEDLFMSGGFSEDKLMKNDPVQWVKNLIEKFRQGTTLDESLEEHV